MATVRHEIALKRSAAAFQRPSIAAGVVSKLKNGQQSNSHRLSYLFDSGLSLRKIIRAFVFRRLNITSVETLRALFAVENASIEALPHWSVLSPCIKTSEQLQNPFARSILFGEMICRTATHTSIGKLLLKKQAWGKIAQADFFEYATSAVDRIFLTAGAPRRDTLESFHGEPFTNECTPLHVRNELAIYLSAFTMKEYIAARDDIGPSQQRCHTVLMKKYALLGEFIATSEKLFDPGRSCVCTFALQKWQHGVTKTDLRVKIFLALSAVDLSISVLMHEVGIHQSSEPCEADEMTSQNYDALAIKEKLVGITKQMFDA